MTWGMKTNQTRGPKITLTLTHSGLSLSEFHSLSPRPGDRISTPRLERTIVGVTKLLHAVRV